MTLKAEAIDYLQEKIDEISIALSLDHFNSKAEWAKASFDYASINIILAEHQKGKPDFSRYENALDAFYKTVKFYQKSDDLPNQAHSTFALTRAMRCYALRRGGDIGISYLNKARKLLARLAHKLNQSELYKILVSCYCEQATLYKDFLLNSHPSKHLSYLHNARNCLTQALAILQRKEDFSIWSQVMIHLGLTYMDLSEVEALIPAKRSLKHAVKIFKSIIEADDIQVPASEDSISPEHLVAQYELAFAYSKIAQLSPIGSPQRESYLKKAITEFKRTTLLGLENLEPVRQLKLYKEQADLTKEIALMSRYDSKSAEQRIKKLKEAINLNQFAVKIATLSSLHDLSAEIYSEIALIYILISYLEEDKLNKIYNIKLAIETRRDQINSIKKCNSDYSAIKENYSLLQDLYNLACHEKSEASYERALYQANKLLVIYERMDKDKKSLYKYLAKIYTKLVSTSAKLDKEIAYKYLLLAIKYVNLAYNDYNLKTILKADSLVKMMPFNEIVRDNLQIMARQLRDIVNDKNLSRFSLKANSILKMAEAALASEAKVKLSPEQIPSKANNIVSKTRLWKDIIKPVMNLCKLPSRIKK